MTEKCDHNIDPGSAFLSPIFAGETTVARERERLTAGLPDFSWYKIPKREKIYQITTNYTKCP
jgi:hypothetical protein